MLRRRHLNIQDDELRVMCNAGLEEDIDHLFFSLPFRRTVLDYHQHHVRYQFTPTREVSCSPPKSQPGILHGGFPDCDLGAIEDAE